MTCQQINNQLDEYIAGELVSEHNAHIEHHLAECAACRSELGMLQALLVRARQLPQELPPQRDLWKGIAAEINAKKIQPLYGPKRNGTRTPWHRHWGIWGVAACVAIIVTIWALGQRDGALQPLQMAPPMAGGNGPQVSVAIGENHQYEQVRERLHQTLNLSKEELSPETITVLEKNMAVIDEAVAQINKALSEDPENPDLKLMLVATQRQAADLLESIAEVRTQQPTTTNELEKESQ